MHTLMGIINIISHTYTAALQFGYKEKEKNQKRI